MTVLRVCGPPLVEGYAELPGQFGGGDVPGSSGVIHRHFALMAAFVVIANERDVLVLHHPEVAGAL